MPKENRGKNGGKNLKFSSLLGNAALNNQGKLKKTCTILCQSNGLYIFVISGSVKVNDVQLETRDGLGVWDTENFTFEITSDKTRILLIDLPVK